MPISFIYRATVFHLFYALQHWPTARLHLTFEQIFRIYRLHWRGFREAIAYILRVRSLSANTNMLARVPSGLLLRRTILFLTES